MFGLYITNPICSVITENDNIKIFLKNLQLKLNVRSARLCSE